MCRYLTDLSLQNNFFLLGYIRQTLIIKNIPGDGWGDSQTDSGLEIDFITQ